VFPYTREDGRRLRPKGETCEASFAANQGGIKNKRRPRFMMT
jgi:hypothetical protein